MFRILENTPFLTVTDEPEEAGEVEVVHVVVAVAVIAEDAPIASVEEPIEGVGELIFEVFNLFPVRRVVEREFEVETKDFLEDIQGFPSGCFPLGDATVGDAVASGVLNLDWAKLDCSRFLFYFHVC